LQDATQSPAAIRRKQETYLALRHRECAGADQQAEGGNGKRGLMKVMKMAMDYAWGRIEQKDAKSAPAWKLHTPALLRVAP
jgi:hypothetical protein